MFILRKITGNNVEINIDLGVSYTLVTKESNPSEFKDMREKHNWDDKIYGFVTFYSPGIDIAPLSDKQKSYIMTENGSTFANISKR